MNLNRQVVTGIYELDQKRKILSISLIDMTAE